MDRIKHLLLRFLREQLTPAEQIELNDWLLADAANRALLEELQDQEVVSEALIDLDQLDRDRHWNKVHRAAESHRPAPVVPLQEADRRRPYRWIAAAVVIGLLGIGVYYGYQGRKQPVTPPVAQTSKATDVPAPATNRATLTLAGGQQVYLDSAGNGALAQQGSAQVVKLASGQVAYKMETSTSRELLYNTLTNPRGSQVVNLTLSDGTKVWLNAASSLRYPVVFAGADRTVEITGEGYFEVASNAGQPFKVKKENTVIEVLGTSFNVNAYTDEPTLKVTLLSGKVRVQKEEGELVLLPGQQASVAASVERSGTVDTAAVMAWKNGRFAFHGADLPTVLRQLSRWYNVEVSYEGTIPEQRFSGRIGRTLTLDQVLKTLTNTGVHYSIESGNKLIIRR